MPVHLRAALAAADNLQGYEQDLLAALVSRRSVRPRLPMSTSCAQTKSAGWEWTSNW